MLMLPSGDPALLAGGAALLDGAALTSIGPIADKLLQRRDCTLSADFVAEVI
jgi:hypothetical protein